MTAIFPDVAGASVFLREVGGATVIQGVTNGSGVISGTYAGSVPQAVQGWARKATAPGPYYEQFTLGGSISSSGYTATALMSEN